MTVLEKPDVLVVDDNDDARFATARVLARNGLSVVDASDGESALAVIIDLRPRLVLLDVILRDESGFDILRHIRGLPELDEMSVVLLSSMRTSIFDRTHGLNSGADGYLVRPIDNDELVARVRAHLRQHDLVARLRRSEQRYRDVIDGQVDGVLIVDSDGTVGYANPSAGLLFGTDRGDLEHHPFGVPVLERTSVVDLRHLDGSSVAVEMSAVDTEWDGRPASLVTLRDITERQRLEEQLRLSQRLESIGQLTGGIAHDFNNLLAVILGASSELRSRVDGELIELSQMIEDAAERGADLVNRLLAFASRQFLEPTVLDVHELARSLLPVLRRALGDVVEIELVDDDTAGSALIDRAGFESGLLNLCLNGRDAMPSGGRLTIQVGRLAVSSPPQTTDDLVPGEYISVSVTDHGAGIESDRLGRVLEPFYTTKAPGVGTGLGLPMVFGFVRQSGGRLDIRSEVGVGTTVTMLLPALARAGPERGQPRDQSHTDAVGAAETRDDQPSGVALPSVLVVDDDDLLRTLVLRQVERLGHDAIGAATVEEARRVLSERQVDLMLSDVRLGGDVNGNELVAEALSQHPGLAVVMMSGLAGDALQPGGNEVPLLGKPFTFEQLRAALARATGG